MKQYYGLSQLMLLWFECAKRKCNKARLHKIWNTSAMKQKILHKINAMKQYYGLSQLMLLWFECVSQNTKCVYKNVWAILQKNLILAQPVFRPLLLPLCTAVDTTILPTTAVHCSALGQNGPAFHSSVGLPPSSRWGSPHQSACTLPCCRTSPRPSITFHFRRNFQWESFHRDFSKTFNIKTQPAKK